MRMTFAIFEKSRDEKGDFTIVRRTIGTYRSFNDAREALIDLMDTSLKPARINEEHSHGWIRYGDPINDEMHYVIEPLK